MDKTNKLILSGIVVVIGLLIVSMFNSGTKLGALSGPDIPYNYFGFGGVRVYSTNQTMNTATTTVCAIQSPAATSTLRWAGARFSVSSTTASTVYLAKAATAYATTTSLGLAALSANAQGTITASTTPTTTTLLDPAYVFGPSQYFVVGMTGGTGTFSPSGSCHATFESYE